MSDRRRVRRSEAGYALLAVLWIMVGVSALTFEITAGAHRAIAPSRNRIALAAASWSAAACVAHVRVTLAAALQDEAPRTVDAPARAWDLVDRILKVSPPPPELGCEIDARPVGSRVDVNSSDSLTLARLFRNAGVPESRADSMAAAVARHAPYLSRHALEEIAGFESASIFDSLLDIEPGPIALDHAPAPVLAMLPGFTEQTATALLTARERGAPIATFLELSQLLSPDEPGASARLPGLAVFQPAAWVLTIRARAGTPTVTSVVEVRLGRGSSGTSIVRRRSWIE